MPTLVIHGDSDAIVPFEISGKRSHEAISGSSLVLIEVTLTSEGRILRERARHIPRAIERATNLSGEEIEDLRGALAELRASLRRALAE